MSGCAILFSAALLPAADCSRTSTGLLPLNDPFFVYPYEGVRGGLYPDGSSRRPPAHEAAGLRLAAEIKPLDGRIVLLSVGMSNTTQEFSAFQQLAARDRDLNPQLTLVDGAPGGRSADRMVANGAEHWATVDQRLRAAGADAAQVQVVWMKQADATPTLRFPDDARRLQSELTAIAGALRSRFPNLKQSGFGFRDPRMLLPDVLPVVRIGGLPAELEYSGPAPGFSGLDQVNVKVPAAAPIGPAVPVELQLASNAGNTATLAVGP